MSSETTARDRLALDRTLLANERTLLAYVRTGLALAGAGAGGGLVFQSWIAWALGGVLIALGPLTVALGFHRFRAVRADLHRAYGDLLDTASAGADRGH